MSTNTVDIEDPAVVDTTAAAPGAELPSPLPVLFVVERDPRGLAVLLSDLARRFGKDFAVRGKSSTPGALKELEELAAERVPVALLLVDHEAYDTVLVRAHELHPHAKRVLLVDRDYSSTSPAVQAFALGRADFHIVRPWANEETMYRAMSEYLAAWTRDQEPGFEQFRIVGAEDDPKALQLRDVFARFGLPFKFYERDSEVGRHLLSAAAPASASGPVVIRYDGEVIVEPRLPDLAGAIGVSVQNDVDTCDLAIVGAGPAGLTAAVYASSEGLETLLLEQGVSGGQAGTSPLIRNYPGFPHGIDGATLMERTCEQAWLMGAHIVFAQGASALAPRGSERILQLGNGAVIRARAVVLAPGIRWRRLGVPQLEALVGKGVFYGAAVSESRAMDGQSVHVVGAGNSAGQAALHLARHASTVTLLVRGDDLSKSMSNYLVRAIESAPNVAVRLETELVDGGGGERLEYLEVFDRRRDTIEELAAKALFVMIGGEPQTHWLPDDVVRDAQGYIATGRELLRQATPRWSLEREPLTMETGLPGVFAAGDARSGSIKNVASAVGDGATAIREVHEYLRA